MTFRRKLSRAKDDVEQIVLRILYPNRVVGTAVYIAVMTVCAVMLVYYSVLIAQIFIGPEAWPTGLWLGCLLIWASRYFLRYLEQRRTWQDEDDD